MACTLAGVCKFKMKTVDSPTFSARSGQSSGVAEAGGCSKFGISFFRNAKTAAAGTPPDILFSRLKNSRVERNRPSPLVADGSAAAAMVDRRIVEQNVAESRIGQARDHSFYDLEIEANRQGFRIPQDDDVGRKPGRIEAKRDGPGSDILAFDQADVLCRRNGQDAARVRNGLIAAGVDFQAIGTLDDVMVRHDISRLHDKSGPHADWHQVRWRRVLAGRKRRIVARVLRLVLLLLFFGVVIAEVQPADVLAKALVLALGLHRQAGEQIARRFLGVFGNRKQRHGLGQIDEPADVLHHLARHGVISGRFLPMLDGRGVLLLPGFGDRQIVQRRTQARLLAASGRVDPLQAFDALGKVLLCRLGVALASAWCTPNRKCGM